jgi:hypothetical protein
VLANVYLHYVLDTWAHHWRRHNARGEVILVRYADDFVMGFENREEAGSFLLELRQRMEKFGLELHSEKTRLIRFGRFATEKVKRTGRNKPETFNFLGFTHLCGRTRKGGFLLLRQTMSKRMRDKLREVRAEMRLRRHQKLADQGRWLGAVLRGYYRYHGVPNNIRALSRFRTEIGRSWHRSLLRRSHKRRLNWERMDKYVTRWLPPAKITHPWPWDRFKAKTQVKSRVR